MIWLLATLALAVGFLLGRARTDRILGWAEDWTASGWRTPRFWLAAPVVVVALAWVWAVHPRRSLANHRSWHDEQEPVPVPQFDPDWAAQRRSQHGQSET